MNLGVLNGPSKEKLNKIINEDKIFKDITVLRTVQRVRSDFEDMSSLGAGGFYVHGVTSRSHVKNLECGMWILVEVSEDSWTEMDETRSWYF